MIKSKELFPPDFEFPLSIGFLIRPLPNLRPRRFHALVMLPRPNTAYTNRTVDTPDQTTPSRPALSVFDRPLSRVLSRPLSRASSRASSRALSQRYLERIVPRGEQRVCRKLASTKLPACATVSSERSTFRGNNAPGRRTNERGKRKKRAEKSRRGVTRRVHELRG